MRKFLRERILSLRERLISGIGGVLSIVLLVLISHHFLGLNGAAMLMSAMGASAVLLFAAPHSPLGQPWPVIGGHCISAAVGVFCSQHISNLTLAGGLAVGLSIFAMHQCRCLHPPGGGTTLAFVVGSQELHEMGYRFVWTPVFVNGVVMVLLAVAFNAFFPWRRYPAWFHRWMQPAPTTPPTVSHEEVVSALKEIDSYIDITEDDLVRLHALLSRKRVAVPRQEELGV